MSGGRDAPVQGSVRFGRAHVPARNVDDGPEQDIGHDRDHQGEADIGHSQQEVGDGSPRRDGEAPHDGEDDPANPELRLHAHMLLSTGPCGNGTIVPIGTFLWIADGDGRRACGVETQDAGGIADHGLQAQR